MTPYYSENGIQLFEGDNRLVLPFLPDASIESCVCDPPYELGFMGKGWDRSGIAYDVNLWREVLRVLRPGAHLLAFGGSRTYHRLACAIEDAGFEIRDQIQWIYGSGFPKSLDVGKAIDERLGVADQRVITHYKPQGPRSMFDGGQPRPASLPASLWNGWGTALKPAHEPIVLARKPLIGTVAENVLTHGTGGLNVDACRIETNGRPLIERRNDKSLDGDVYGSGMNGSRQLDPTDLGRWPANVIHDGSDEVLAEFPESNRGAWPANGAKFGYSGGERTQTGERTEMDAGNAARFFYCAKASQDDREEGLEDLQMRSAGDVTDRKDGSDGLNSPRAGTGRTNGSRNHHPTVKPTSLMRYLVRLITPPNGTCLDPFLGSGSTGRAAALEGFDFIGIELNADYCELAKRRIMAVTKQGKLMFA